MSSCDNWIKKKREITSNDKVEIIAILEARKRKLKIGSITQRWDLYIFIVKIF